MYKKCLYFTPTPPHSSTELSEGIHTSFGDKNAHKSVPLSPRYSGIALTKGILSCGTMNTGKI